MLDQISEIAVIARGHGLLPVVHPHAGGYIEFADEIERLVADTDLDLCIDTGHFALARIDPAKAIGQYADRLGHVHFKDIRPDVLARIDAESLDFWRAIEAGIFCPLGEGLVDLGAVLAALDARRLQRLRDDRAGPDPRQRSAARRSPPEPRRARRGDEVAGAWPPSTPRSRSDPSWARRLTGMPNAGASSTSTSTVETSTSSTPQRAPTSRPTWVRR